MDLSPCASRAVLLMLAVIFSLSEACGASDNPDKKAIETLERAQYAAGNARDFDAWSALFTDAGLQQAFPGAEDRTREGLRKLWLSYTNGTDTVSGVSDIFINGSEGSATATFAGAGRNGDPTSHMVYARRDRLVKVDGAWKIDASDFASPAIPDGTRVVPVIAHECSYSFDASAMQDGTFAIQLENAGHQTHQIHLLRIAPDLNIENWIRGEETSLENVDIGSTSLLAPGDAVNVPFSAPLPKGRYVMACSLPDTDDPARTPHSQKGMYKEFTVR